MTNKFGKKLGTHYCDHQGELYQLSITSTRWGHIYAIHTMFVYLDQIFYKNQSCIKYRVLRFLNDREK